MNIKTRFQEYCKATHHAAHADIEPSPDAVIQAAATLVLAEVIQGTTHAVDLTFDGGTNRMNVEVSGDERYPIQVQADVSQV